MAYLSCIYCQQNTDSTNPFCSSCHKRIPLQNRISKQKFIELYLNQDMTLEKIASGYHISFIYAWRLKKKYGILRKPYRSTNFNKLPSEKPFPEWFRHPIKKEDFERMYSVEKKTLNDIASFYGVTRQTIYKYRKSFGVKAKSRTDYAGYFLKEDTFSSWTEGSAWVLGLIITDGCIAEGAASLRLTYCCSDQELVEKFRDVFCSNHPIRIIEPRGFSKKTQFSLTISNQKIIKDLQSFGIAPRKSLTVKFPSIPKEYLRHFIRGVFEGDGSIHITGGTLEKPIYRITFVSGSEDFIDGLVSSIYTNFNLAGQIHKDSRKNCYQLAYTKTESVHKLGKSMYDTVSENILLRRKRSIFNDFERTQYSRVLKKLLV